MRILLINHFPLQGSGSGVYVTNIAKSLEKKGHKTCIITPENTSIFSDLKNIRLHPVFFKYKEKIEGQQEFNFPCFDPHPRSSFRFADMTNSQLEQYKSVFRKAIEEEIREFKPDIIHAQHIWILSSVALEYHIPVVVTCHGSDIMGYEHLPQFRDMMRKVTNGCKKIIVISNSSKKIISNIFKEDKEKIITISNGYDKNLFYRANYDKREILKEFNINKEFTKIVCFAGRLARNKGVDLLLQAAKCYEKDDVLTLIAGSGEEYHNLNKMKEELGLNNIVFLGNQNYDNLRKMYNISDVCAVPSRKEAFGLVALEAIACGTPVVAINQGGIPDFVNEKVGILVQKEEVNKLGQVIQKVLNGEVKFDSEYLAEYARENYNQDVFIDQLIETYKSCLK